MYTVLNETYSRGRSVELPDRGVDMWGRCHPIIICVVDITISPTDMRYNGAMITGIVDHLDCFNSSNVTDSFTLKIQGICIKVLLTCTPQFYCVYSEYSNTLLQVPRKLCIELL